MRSIVSPSALSDDLCSYFEHAITGAQAIVMLRYSVAFYLGKTPLFNSMTLLGTICSL